MDPTGLPGRSQHGFDGGKELAGLAWTPHAALRLLFEPFTHPLKGNGGHIQSLGRLLSRCPRCWTLDFPPSNPLLFPPVWLNCSPQWKLHFTFLRRMALVF